MIFINTRPTTRSEPLTDFLQSQGVNVVGLPLLELVACELAEQEKYHLNQINAYHILIFISETAITYFFDFVKNNQIHLTPSLHIVAVGQKTAQIFNNFWQKIFDESINVITPSDFNLPENNEGLLALPIVQMLKKNDKILILKGKDGRALLKNSLIAKGVQVNEVDFYQRILPLHAERIFRYFCRNFQYNYFISEKKVVLISSLTAWQHWQALCDKFGVASEQFCYLILQTRIFQHIVQQIPIQNLTQIEDLRPKTIFQALSYLENG